MARKRSEMELYRLSGYASRRVYEGRGGQLSQSVSDKALEGARRIENSKSYKNAQNRMLGKSVAEREEIAHKAVNRKYSPRTYLGTANG